MDICGGGGGGGVVGRLWHHTYPPVTGMAYLCSVLDAEIVSVPGDAGLHVMKSVPVLGSQDKTINVIVRSCTEPFWRQCIDVAKGGSRVCAVGSPGIGKSTSTAFLIRILLKAGHTVLYLRREVERGGDGAGPIFEFSVQDGQPRVQLHPEVRFSDHHKIDALLDPNTFFVIDPQKTKDSCDPSAKVKARVIINASPDMRHWGENEFTKMRDATPAGRFLYYPIWSDVELCDARCWIDATVSHEEVLQRFDQFGGVPRSVFAPACDLDMLLEKLQHGVRDLTDKQILQLVDGNVAYLDALSPTQPKSSVMGYDVASPQDFRRPRTVVISKLALMTVWVQHIGVLWNRVVGADKDSVQGHAFEEYVRALMLTQLPPLPCRYYKSKHFQFPRCTRIQMVSDPLLSVRQLEERVVYHSVSQQYPWVDFAIKQGKLVIAVQVTTGATHSTSPSDIDKLVRLCGPTLQVVVVYAVPLELLGSFRLQVKKRNVAPHTNCIFVGINRPVLLALPDNGMPMKRARK